MTKINKGNVVKFIDAEGLLNGGTVIEFTKAGNEEYALINTLDGKKVRKRISDVHPINRQQRGRVSAVFLEKLKEEIEQENANTPKEERIVPKSPSAVEEVQRMVYTAPVVNEESEEVDRLKCLLIKKDEIIECYQREIKDHRKRINELERKCTESNSLSQNSEHLILTIKGLGDALLATSLNKEGDMVQELLKVINKLNGL